MRKTDLALLFLIFAAAFCSGKSSDGIVVTLDSPSACEVLGATRCSVDEEGAVVVLKCSLEAGDLLVWKISEYCADGCIDGACVTGELDSVVELDSIDVDTDVSSGDVMQEAEVADLVSDVCVPNCSGKKCGDDGCGGTCGECPEGYVCLPDGSGCCMPQCQGKLCGDDGCGGTCGDCPEDQECGAYFQCVPKCKPQCEGRECGPDGCGGTCGECPPGKGCDPQGKCTLCVPQCDGKECGDNGCGGSCGACPYGWKCIDGKCSEPCAPICVGKECGDDGCGGSCGMCPPGSKCIDFKCVIVCEPACAGKECGPDGCGGSCGKCPPWGWCSPQGLCILECDGPNCEGKECGPDGCGGTCGSCPSGQWCSPAGTCQPPGGPCGSVTETGWCDGNVLLTCIGGVLSAVDCKTMGKNVTCQWLESQAAYGCFDNGEVCVPDCQNKECGSDGCGGSCGECLPGQSCVGGVCEGFGPCGEIPPEGCCEGDVVLWCDNGVVWHMDCASMLDPNKRKCGWNEELGFYDCVSEKIPGPDYLPYYCSGPCVPSCAGKQCGDDGCGGDCGKCPPGTSCQGNVCKGDDSECGGYSNKPTCQGDTVVWCENGKVFFQNCSDLGPFFHCGWVSDLYGYGCYEEECVPDCEGKECGDDGCGYVCGYCPVTMTCNDEGQCVYGQGLCGDVDYTGVCEGNKVKWCQSGVLQVFDCANLGPTWHCGWYEAGGYYWCLNE